MAIIFRYLKTNSFTFQCIKQVCWFSANTGCFLKVSCFLVSLKKKLFNAGQYLLLQTSHCPAVKTTAMSFIFVEYCGCWIVSGFGLELQTTMLMNLGSEIQSSVFHKFLGFIKNVFMESLRSTNERFVFFITTTFCLLGRFLSPGSILLEPYECRSCAHSFTKQTTVWFNSASWKSPKHICFNVVLLQENISLLIDAAVMNQDPSPDDVLDVTRIIQCSMKCINVLGDTRATKSSIIGRK